MFFVFALLLGFERVPEAQTKPEKTQSEQDKNRPKLVALKSGEPDELTYEVTHSEGVLPYRTTFKHNDRGNQTEWSTYDKTGRRGIKVSSGYSDDSRGNPTEFVRYNSDDKVVSKEVYTYEFDSRGNWIKSKTIREMFGGQAPIIEKEITYRTITYRQPR